MSRINSNIQSLIGQRVLGINNKDLGTSLERLSTGLRINRGADDPAGLIASENLRAEKAALVAAVSNAERAEQVVNIAEGGLQELSSLLTELEGLVTATANTAGVSRDERAANQLQIDSILQSIDRIAASTSFQGTKLLNGNFDYVTSSVSADVATFKVNAAKLNKGQTLDVDVIVTNSAQIGGYLLSFGVAGIIDTAGPTSQFVFEIRGSQGARELSFASGTVLADVVAAINTFVEVTGVEAVVVGASGIRLESSRVGEDEFVGLTVKDDGGIGAAANIGIYEFAATDTAVASVATLIAFGAVAAGAGLTDFGQDVEATVNGVVGVTNGSTVSINTDFLNVAVDLTIGAPLGAGANAQTLGRVDAFTITGGGADFQLSSKVDIAGKVSLGIANVAARDIGRSVIDVNGTDTVFTLSDLQSGKALNVVDGNLPASQRVVDATIKEISSLRGRLGAFQKNTVGATIRSLGIAVENTTAAESAIRDADFASETAGLTRSQILVSSTTTVLGLANSQPQAVLQLLG